MIDGSVIATIPVFHPLNFTASNCSKFAFVGSILETTFRYVPADNAVINEYSNQPTSGSRPLTAKMQKALEEANKPKKRGKPKTKVGPSKPAAILKKIKRAAHKPRSHFPVAPEESESRTLS